MFPSVDPANLAPTASKIYLVAGAIGKAIAHQLFAKPNVEIVLVCRNAQKAQQMVTEITTTIDNRRIRFELTNMGRLKETQHLAEGWTVPAACAIPSFRGLYRTLRQGG